MANERTDNRESVTHMFSEFFRELAALILVFVPLDYLLKGTQLGPRFWPEALGVAISSGYLLTFGILIERRGK
jgi:hypothetical protein